MSIKALVGAVGCCIALQPACVQAEPIQPSGYTLVVTLTPAICALNPALQRLRQCQEGFSLTVASLQPQLKNGKTIENCSQQPADLPPLQERIVERVMPDEQLRNRDWQRTGSCTGMSARNYFRTIAAFAGRLRVPPEFNAEQEVLIDRNQLVGRLVDLNPGLRSDGLQLRCADHESFNNPILTEMRVCYSVRGQYASCPASVQSNCPARFIVHGSP